jgi:hypothetical protein
MLKDELMSEILWRYKELKNIKILYDSNVNYKKIGESNFVSVENTRQSKYILRSSIPLIYAHWEGFFKKSIELLNYELDKINNINYNRLNNILLVSLVKDKHADKYLHNKFLFSEIIIDTESNLSLKVIKKFSKRYNFNFNDFYKQKHIIEQLLKVRNGISHGENAYHFNDFKKIQEYINTVISLMIIVKNNVINCLKYKKYYKEQNE